MVGQRPDSVLGTYMEASISNSFDRKLRKSKQCDEETV